MTINKWLASMWPPTWETVGYWMIWLGCTVMIASAFWGGFDD